MRLDSFGFASSLSRVVILTPFTTRLVAACAAGSLSKLTRGNCSTSKSSCETTRTRAYTLMPLIPPPPPSPNPLFAEIICKITFFRRDPNPSYSPSS